MLALAPLQEQVSQTFSNRRNLRSEQESQRMLYVRRALAHCISRLQLEVDWLAVDSLALVLHQTRSSSW